MQTSGWLNARTVVIAVVALGLIAAVLIATGGGLSTSRSAQPVQATPTPTALPKGTKLAGKVIAQATPLANGVYQFRYTVQNLAGASIAGFQVNSAKANLYDIHAPAGWHAFGSGICQGKYPGVLAYWTVNKDGNGVIKRGKSVEFRFRVRTSGTMTGGYSLSWGSLKPFFGKLTVPKGSSLPAAGPCS